jgi:4-carboxymuconolactone decarboxylase
MNRSRITGYRAGTMNIWRILIDDQDHHEQALATAERLLGHPLVLPFSPAERASGADFRRLATVHTFGHSWARSALDDRSRALVSVAIAAALGTREPLRGQLRIALNNGASKDEIVDLFIHLEAYAGAARAFDMYQTAIEAFSANSQPNPLTQRHERAAGRATGQTLKRANGVRAWREVAAEILGYDADAVWRRVKRLRSWETSLCAGVRGSLITFPYSFAVLGLCLVPDPPQ